MGVTIHFEGKAKSEENVDSIISLAKNFAIRNNMPFQMVNVSSGQLSRLINEQDAPYEGPVQGIKIEPHYNCEQLIFEFGNDLFMQDYCKTQFAPIEVHISIIKLFKSVLPHFTALSVIDEGQYWDTEDTDILQQEMDYCFAQIEKIQNEDSTVKGPIRSDKGRIIDLIR